MNTLRQNVTITDMCCQTERPASRKGIASYCCTFALCQTREISGQTEGVEN